MKDIEDKLAAFLMDHGVLKNADADKMARKIAGMFEKEREELIRLLGGADDTMKVAKSHRILLESKLQEVKTIAALREQERDQLAAKCAEMTMAIQNLITFGLDGTDPKEVNHALSDDCGKGWISPERKELLRRKLICLKEVVCTEDSALVQEALDEIQ